MSAQVGGAIRAPREGQVPRASGPGSLPWPRECLSPGPGSPPETIGSLAFFSVLGAMFRLMKKKNEGMGIQSLAAGPTVGLRLAAAPAGGPG